MGDRFGYDLTGVPRNAETENIFRTAAKLGEPDFLDWDEIIAEPLTIEIAGYRCRETELMNVLHRCMNGIEHYVLQNGVQPAMKHYFNSDGCDLGYYVLVKKAFNHAMRFAADVQDVIAKYRPACRRVEKTLPDVMIHGKPVKAVEIRNICATPVESVEKTENCADYLAQKYAAKNRGYRVSDQRAASFPADVSDSSCLAL